MNENDTPDQPASPEQPAPQAPESTRAGHDMPSAFTSAAGAPPRSRPSSTRLRRAERGAGRSLRHYHPCRSERAHRSRHPVRCGGCRFDSTGHADRCEVEGEEALRRGQGRSSHRRCIPRRRCRRSRHELPRKHAVGAAVRVDRHQPRHDHGQQPRLRRRDDSDRDRCASLGRHDPGRGVEPSGSGSGVILSEDGYVLTDTHVATLGGAEAGSRTSAFTASDGHIYNAEIVGTDPIYDLAVIKLEDAEGLKPIEFADSSEINVGSTAVAVGAPLGLSNSVTTGIVSALNRSIQIASSAAPDSATEDAPEDEGGQGSPFQFDLPGTEQQGAGQSISISSSRRMRRSTPETPAVLSSTARASSSASTSPSRRPAAPRSPAPSVSASRSRRTSPSACPKRSSRTAPPRTACWARPFRMPRRSRAQTSPVP